MSLDEHIALLAAGAAGDSPPPRAGGVAGGVSFTGGPSDA